jgi:hypothetical protein
VPLSDAAEQETRHGFDRSPIASVDYACNAFIVCAARARRSRRAVHRQLAGDCRSHRTAVSARARREAGRGRHSRPGQVADVPRHPRASRRIGPHRLRGAWFAPGRDRRRDAAAVARRRLPLHPRDHRARSGRRCLDRDAGPRTAPCARARRGAMGRRRRSAHRAVSIDWPLELRRPGPLLRHAGRRGGWPPGARRTARLPSARRVESSSDPSRRATSSRPRARGTPGSRQ